MLSLRTVILHHTTRQGSHYDWLMEDPRTAADPQSLLWTARVAHPPWLWRGDQRQLLTPLTPHRRHYLQYQGPVSADRGSVKRVAQGRFHPLCWTTHRLQLQIHWQPPYASATRASQNTSSASMLVDVTLTAQSCWLVAHTCEQGIIPAIGV